jgi:hypothetical protein
MLEFLNPPPQLSRELLLLDFQINQEREMIGSVFNQGRLSDDFAGLHTRQISRGQKDVIEPDVRLPDGKSVAFVIGVKGAKAVQISGVKHRLNGVAADVASRKPDQRANPERHQVKIENFAGRERVEIADDDVKAVLMLFDTV